MYRIPIIYSKITPPIPPATYMVRSRLTRQLNKINEYELTLVHSGAGYGKSTGLAQYVKNSNILCAWYTVTEEDDDILPFISYLKESIIKIIPTFGDTMKDIVLDADRMFQNEELQQWLALFINELSSIQEDLYIIIDDYHLIDHVFSINHIMENIIRLIPPNIHLIIVTRSTISWSNIPRLKVENKLLEINKDDLSFTKEEMIIYLEEYFGLVVDEAVTEEVMNITEGWPIAIYLIAINFPQLDTNFTNYDKLVFKNLFDYLSEEVFKHRNEREQDALLKYALFPTFSKSLIASFYDEETASLLDNRLTELGFIQSLEEENTFRYHALFQQFLMNKWLQINPQRYQQLHVDASHYFSGKGNYLQSLYHATQTKEPLFIAEKLSKSGKFLVQSGQFDRYMELFRLIPLNELQTFYSLYFYAGEVQRYQAFYEKAHQAYESCLVHAQENKDDYYISKANAGIAHIYLDTIQPKLAEPYLQAAIINAQFAEKMSNNEQLMLQRQFAENLVNLGEASKAKTWMDTESIGKEVIEKGNLDARILLRMGNLREVVAVLVERLTDKKLPDAHRETEVLLAFVYGMLGEGELALYYAKDGIKTAKEEKSSFTEAVGYTRAGHAQILLTTFNLHVAEKLFEQAIHKMDELRVSRGKVEPLMGLAIVKIRKSHYQNAIIYSKEALYETKKANDKWMSSLIYICLTMASYYQKEYEQAKQYIEQAQRLLRISGDKFGEMITCFWLLLIYQVVGETDEFKVAALQFSALCVEEDYSFFIKQDTLLGPVDRQIMYPLFQEMNKLLPDNEHIQMLLHILEIDMTQDYPGYQIKIKGFGSFQLYVGTNIVEKKQWQREKAKELLLFLLFQRDRYTSKEVMIDALWPNHERKSADQNFKVTLNALLKVIEPNRKARKESFFIQRKNSMYRLNPKAKVLFDVDYFLHMVDKGFKESNRDKSITLLNKAVALYDSRVIEEVKDAYWYTEKQLQLENKYVQSLEQLVVHHFDLANYQQVIKWSEIIIEVNPTWESAYRYLMQAYYYLKNRPQSIKWYNQCVVVLNNELKIEPMEETKNLYQMIVDNNYYEMK